MYSGWEGVLVVWASAGVVVSYVGGLGLYSSFPPYSLLSLGIREACMPLSAPVLS